jgi:hypothetical protein
MMKTRKKQPKQRQITIEEFDRDMPRAMAAARKPGGVLVVDAHGKLRFHLIVPQGVAPETYE